MGTSCACVPSGNTYDACKSGQLMLLCEAAVFCGDDSIQDKAGLVLLLMAHRLEFVREACQPASFVDSSWKPTGYKVTEISWGVVQNNGQPYMQPGIQTDLMLEHSEGEEFVNEQDRQKNWLGNRQAEGEPSLANLQGLHARAAALLEGHPLQLKSYLK